nr:MAG: hypothetical protein DIU74_11180 [Pseudomonadota bacterium]
MAAGDARLRGFRARPCLAAARHGLFQCAGRFQHAARAAAAAYVLGLFPGCPAAGGDGARGPADQPFRADVRGRRRAERRDPVLGKSGRRLAAAPRAGAGGGDRAARLFRRRAGL